MRSQSRSSLCQVLQGGAFAVKLANCIPETEALSQSAKNVPPLKRRMPYCARQQLTGRQCHMPSAPTQATTCDKAFLYMGISVMP